MKNYYMNECPYKKPTITFKHIIIFLLCATLCVSMHSLLKNFDILQTQLHYIEYLNQLEQQKNTEGFDSLKQINSDFLAWITIDDVNLSLPIVETKTKNQEDFYLNHGFNKKHNKLGCPYQSFKCSLDNNYTMFIGHSSYNISLFGQKNNESVFGKLNSYIDKSGAYTYSVKLETQTKTLNYQIVGFFNFNITDTSNAKYQEIYDNIYNISSLNTQSRFDRFNSTLKKYSFVNLGQELNFGDKILTLFTCYSNLDYRTIVVAKQV